ncbi:MAG: exonuclease SbcCD subunit D [Candidatus Bathyarchaeota archaeon]|nr:MAG: exonuclease SbcCD subunit D [Candidatus Bathyarchaeota archaeon]
MKFAHMSDCHLGGWRDPTLQEIGLQCFERAIDICIKEEVGFILICGDLFDTSRPAIEVLERAVTKFKEAKDAGIKSYVIEGSHDFSPTGKTMLRVLEKAGLFVRVAKGQHTEEGKLRLAFVTDEKTGAKITGLIGRKGALEREIYQNLDNESLQQETGFKIFMLHTGLDELKPDIFRQVESMPISLLPKGFDYYAGGHIHKQSEDNWEDYGKIVYPGPTFPADFRELERLASGGFYIVTKSGRKLEAEWKKLDIYSVLTLGIDADGKTPKDVEGEISRRFETSDAKGKIVLLRVEGTLASGRPSDIDFRGLISLLTEKGAQLVKKRTSKLSTKEFEEIKVSPTSRGDLEDRLIREHIGQCKLGPLTSDELVGLTKSLLKALAEGKTLDETNKNYNERMMNSIISVLGIKDEWEKTA